MNSKKLQILFPDFLGVTINVCFNVTYFFEEIFLNIMLKKLPLVADFKLPGRLFQVLGPTQ